MADAIRATYGLEAEVLPPPPALTSDGPEQEVLGLEPGYFLCIARLLPYKNVQVVAEAVALVPGARLVIVGDGPARADIEMAAGPRVQFLGQVDDATLRWLYRNSVALVSASFEDYGLTPTVLHRHYCERNNPAQAATVTNASRPANRHLLHETSFSSLPVRFMGVVPCLVD